MKTVYLYKTVAVCDLKVGRCRQLIQLMKVCEYSRSRSFFDLATRSYTYENLKLAFLRNHWAILPNFECKLFGTWK